MKEPDETSMEVDDRHSTSDEEKSSPKKSNVKDSSIIKYLRGKSSTRSESVQGQKIPATSTTETYVNNENQRKIKVSGRSQVNRRRTLRNMELQRNKYEHSVQGGNVKIKKEKLDLSLEEMSRQSLYTGRTMEESSDEESIYELSDSGDYITDRETKDEVMDAEVAEIETKLRNSIAVNRKPWEGYSSRKKIKKFYSDVSDFQKKTYEDNSICYGEGIKNTEEVQEW